MDRMGSSSDGSSRVPLAGSPPQRHRMHRWDIDLIWLQPLPPPLLSSLPLRRSTHSCLPGLLRPASASQFHLPRFPLPFPFRMSYNYSTAELPDVAIGNTSFHPDQSLGSVLGTADRPMP